jgi:hypothetical protein
MAYFPTVKQIARVRKAVVAAAGALVSIAALYFNQEVVAAVTNAFAAIGVYVAPNAE